jgi:phosphate/sulfate permease
VKTKFDFSVFQFNLLPVCGVCVSLFVVSAFEKNSNKNKEKKEDKNIEKKKKKVIKSLTQLIHPPASLHTKS